MCLPKFTILLWIFYLISILSIGMVHSLNFRIFVCIFVALSILSIDFQVWFCWLSTTNLFINQRTFVVRYAFKLILLKLREGILNFLALSWTILWLWSSDLIFLVSRIPIILDLAVTICHLIGVSLMNLKIFFAGFRRQTVVLIHFVLLIFISNKLILWDPFYKTFFLTAQIN